MNLNLFDKAGRYTAPDAATLAKLATLEAELIGNIGDAAHALDVAMTAVESNADALKKTQAEIAELVKIVPTVTRIDLVKQMSRETQLRRAGL